MRERLLIFIDAEVRRLSWPNHSKVCSVVMVLCSRVSIEPAICQNGMEYHVFGVIRPTAELIMYTQVILHVYVSSRSRVYYASVTKHNAL